MLADYPAIAAIPAKDIERAKGFYQDKLGLKPTEDLGGQAGFRYDSGGTWFLLYPSGFAGTNQATAVSWPVDDIEATVAELKGRGVVFEEYDLPEIKTEGSIFTAPDGARGAWFKDSEGNILGVFTLA